MEKVSKILGKPVINIFEGKLEGYVKNIYADKKLQKVLWLCLFDDETQEEKLVDCKGIYCFKENAVMIKNSSELYLFDTIKLEELNPIGYKVYSLDGKETGKILDFEVDDKFNIQEIYLQDNTTLDKKYILCIGNNVIIQKDNIHISVANFRPKQPVEVQNQTNQKVEILTTENQTKISPKKVLTAGYEFLIGRKVGQNIFAENGQLIAKKQSKITSQIIDIASQNGKLKELTTYSVI